jgi:pyruvate/2-oxoglutarate/acetoin dehydrogenase E1 component
MPDYLAVMNGLIVEKAARYPDLVQYGENILQGSRICGIARKLSGRVINVGNCENTHVGAGFGMMLNGADAVLFVKQLDFLLLAVDPMVNTYNQIRASNDVTRLGSFTIVAIVCDQGWQGPQSSFNDLPGICSLARVDGYCLSNAGEARGIVARHLVRPGFRVLALSQRLFGTEALDLPVMDCSADDAVCQYLSGGEATVVCLNFSLPEAVRLTAGRSVSLFTVHPAGAHRWERIVQSAAVTRRLIVFDDSKGSVSMAHKIASRVLRVAPQCQVSIHTREAELSYAVGPDRFEVPAALAI